MRKRFACLLLLLCLFCLPALAEEDSEALPMDDIIWEDDDELTLDVLLSTAPPPTAVPVTKAPASPEDVTTIQRQLSALGYYTGEVTGNLGDATRLAIIAFQEDVGLKVTGEADPATLTTLANTQYRPLRLGSQGEAVKELQIRLMSLGYYTGKISGNYLAATQEAVEDFQRRNAITPTGVADAATQEALYASSARSRTDSSLPTPTPAPQSTQEVTFLVDEDAVPTPTPMPTVAFVKQLKYEVTGAAEEIKLLQERLTELGYYEGNISGNFLGHTRNAVKAFQTHNAMEADGIVGQDTWDILFNDPDVRAASDDPKPTPVPTPVPFAITVDVKNQVTTVYGRDENGEYNVVVRQMLCSTGTRGYPSDVGDWVLSGRTARWCYFPKWGGHAQYWTKINSSIAFHSVVYNSVDTMDLSVKSYKNLGSRASHGCIRLTVADAKWIYYNCGEGTVVTITEDLPSDPELRASLKLPALNYSNMLPYVTAEPTAPPVYVSGTQPPQPFKTLKKGQTSEAVFWLQSKLTELGYYSGKISGTYLDGTASAVKAFQKANGIYQDGVANEKTLRKIYEQELATPTPPPTATPAP